MTQNKNTNIFEQILYFLGIWLQEVGLGLKGTDFLQKKTLLENKLQRSDLRKVALIKKF
jgi:hypothetical protein